MLLSSLVGSAAAAATIPGTLELSMVTLGGLLPHRKRPAAGGAPLRKMAVVVPAHDERPTIARCVESLRAATPPRAACQIIVVADNCTDDTAALAEAAGAEVWVREDPTNRGKGYALAYAFERLMADPEVDALLVVDADTTVADNYLVSSEAGFVSGADAVQCRYLVRNPGESEKARLMNVALMAFNVLRPRGRCRLGFSAGILGNGWGVSRRCLEQEPYSARSVVEDLEYHIRLVRAGLQVVFLDDTTVYGDMPTDDSAAESQRARWEGGRFRMVREHIPGLLAEIARGRLRLLEPAGELLLLPLAYHVGGLAITLVIPFPPTQLYALSGLLIVAAHVAAGLWVGGATAADIKALLGAPGYILWKAGILKGIVGASRRDQAWVRTARR